MVVGLVGVKLLLVSVNRVGMSKKAMCRRNRYLFENGRTDLILKILENEIHDMIGFSNVLRTPQIFFYYSSSRKRSICAKVSGRVLRASDRGAV